MVEPRRILGCPNCSFGKSKTTHTYGSYRVYVSAATQVITLKCKTCKHEQKYKYIQGGIIGS